MSKPLTLSIIIPAYNEERHLHACLKAIANQSEAPDEVIVVDNNSDDRTASIAGTYSFVTLIHEKKQGITPARNAGFNMAKGDIIGRIDADAVVATNWVSEVKKTFKEDETLTAVTGLGAADIFPRTDVFKTVVWSWLYFVWSEAYYGSYSLWGANMALRRNAWLKVRHKTCADDKIVHEDQDISIVLLANGGKLRRSNRLRITTGGQTYHYFPKLWQYTVRRWSTKRFNRKNGNLAKIKPKFPLWRRILTYVFLTPLVVFYIASFCLWPIDWAMKKAGREKTWLD